MRRTKRGIVVACLCVLLCLFGRFIWPTPWREWKIYRHHTYYYFATNRFTGQVESVDIGFFADAPIPVTEETLRNDKWLAPFTDEDARQMHRRW